MVARFHEMGLGLGTFRRRFGTQSAAVSLCGLVALALGISGWLVSSFTSDSEPEFLERFRGGTLIIAGGGDLPSIVNQRFWELAGGRNGRLVILPAYEAQPDDIQRLKLEWKHWPFSSIQVLQATSRASAEEPDFALPIGRANAVWFSGGEQSWLAQLYAETPVETELQALLDRGGIIGGTSAGASIMTRVMIEEGQRHAKLNRGLDLLKDAIVDQHFFYRNRTQRLMQAIQEQPHLVGFGVDEGTALVVQVPSGRLGVIGKSYVMACVARPEFIAPRLEILKPGDSVSLDGLLRFDKTTLEEALQLTQEDIGLTDVEFEEMADASDESVEYESWIEMDAA